MLTRDFKETVAGRIEKDPEYRKSLIGEEDYRLYIAQDLLRARDDVLYFFENLKTVDIDEPDPSKRIKSFPIHKKYLRHLVTMAMTEKKLAIYKCRQMIVTWSMCGVSMHEVLFKPGSYVGLVSKKEESAGKLIGRIKFMYDHLPSYWKLGLPEPQYYRAKKAIYVKMICQHPDGPESIIEAYPEGGDQLRSDAYSLIYWDEVGVCDDLLCRQTYAAAKPPLGNNGRFIMSSTPPRYPEHFWYAICTGKYLEQ